MVVLVGGSSTGKTRAAFEAVREYLPDWVLLRPADATELVQQLASGVVVPNTVLWVNETQEFLRDQPEAAVALRRLLAGDDPVVVVGTMWPQFWKDLTHRPAAVERDVHYQARELLNSAVRLEVPEVFADEDLAELRRQMGNDQRLEAAARAAYSDGKVIQVLAGGPALVLRYERPADGDERYGQAVVTAAMDIRRLGHEAPISRALLEAAAPVYLDRPDLVDVPDGWFGIGMASATAEVNGIAALTARRERPGVGPAYGYALHDYLYQYARAARRGILAPATVWNALAAHTTNLVDRTRLAQQAEWRGLYRHAVMLARPAAEAGAPAAMQVMATRLEQAVTLTKLRSGGSEPPRRATHPPR
jgi:hypothetical protein